jgi:two-component system chemotaxis response regulator CheB
VIDLVTRTQPDPRPATAPGHDAIVIGASAGGVDAVMALAAGLPARLPAAVFVVIHMSATAPGLLSGLVDRAGPLPAGYAQDGAEVLPGRIYLAPVDHHLLIERDGPRRRMRVWRGPKENGFRPAIDPLFRSAARAYGRRAVGVILSGYLDDGTLGLMLIKRRGGVAVVQDPRTAACPDMPRAAVENVDCDYVVPLEAMPQLFARLASEPPSPVTSQTGGVLAMTADIHSGAEDGPVEMTPNTIERKQARDGPPSALTCPECGGALWEQRVDNVMRYSCHVGHGYTGESLEEQYVREVEAALWSAMRHLVESAELHRRLAARMRESGPADRAADYEQRATETEHRAAVIRDLLVKDRVGGLIGRRHEPGVSRPTDPA